MELDSVELPYPKYNAKSLLVCDDKKQNYYLITVRGNKRVDLKEFRRKYGYDMEEGRRIGTTG